jgi:hypothetical protein
MSNSKSVGKLILPYAFNPIKNITNNNIQYDFKNLKSYSQPIINLDDNLFLTEEINQIIKPVNNHFNPENIKLIKAKINQVKPKIVINHRIDATQYKDVFIISDIHADLRKFYSILKNSKMIESSFNPYNDDIENPELISTAKWLPRDTLLIIVGDLVDGGRGNNSVDDPAGSFELKLHILLYNLRLQAINMNSNIIFTLGNHDCETINENNELENYIHTTSYDYFNIKSNIAIRREALKPFYTLSPYIFIVLSTPSHKNEIICVHAGLHINNKALTETPNIKNIKKIDSIILEKLQSEINIYGIELLNDYYKILQPDGSYKKTSIINPNPNIDFYKSQSAFSNSIWTRLYAEINEEQCNIIDYNNEYKMIVVGHCPTNIGEYENILKIIFRNTDKYSHCQTYMNITKAGCVITRCNELPSNGDIIGAPRIALVDTGLSSTFRPQLDNKEEINYNRPIELLHLHHDSNYSITNRYYNNIKRFLVSPSESREIIVYQSLSTATAKHKYLKYKNKYALLKNRVL